MTKNGFFSLLFHTLFLSFILLPLVVVCLVAFTDKGYLSMPFDGASLRWFVAILDNQDFIDAFKFSFILALVSTIISIIIAIPAALAFARYRFWGRALIMAFLMSPMMIPHLVLGVAFLQFLSQIGLSGTFLGISLAHVILITPYTLRLILASLVGMDTSVEQAGVSLGGNVWVVFRRITLPMIIPGVTGGGVLAFITSFDELTMSAFIASPETMTLPVRMYHHIMETIDPLVTSVSAVIIFLTLILMFILERFYGLDKILMGRGK